MRHRDVWRLNFRETPHEQIQCDILSTHLKTHTGEKSHNCKYDAFWQRRRSGSSAIHVSLACDKMCEMSQRFNRTRIQPVLELLHILSHANVSCIVLRKDTLEKRHTIACKYDASVSWQRGRSEASAIAQCFPNNRFISHPQRHILLSEMRHKYFKSSWWKSGKYL